MEEKSKFKYKHSVLILDDEPGILKAIKRVLRKIQCESVLTTNPKEAAGLIKNRKPPFSLIISDQRMPEIQGAQFLEYARKLSPYSVRYLITGYTEIDTLIDAINKGGIHRFIAKPWDEDDLIRAVEDGLRQYEIFLENRRLMAIVARQNKALSIANDDLEKRIEERTSEIQKKNNDLESKNQELTDSIFNTIRTLDVIISTIDRDLSLHGQRVADIAIKLGQKLGFSNEELRILEISALLHDIGVLSMQEPLRSFNTRDPKHSDSKKYFAHPETGEDILKPIPQLHKCSAIVRHHHENYDGSGFPDRLEGGNIPIESRIIAIADNYDKLHMNRNKRNEVVKRFMTSRNLSKSEMPRTKLMENAILYNLQQSTFTLFDPDVLKVMTELIKAGSLDYSIEMDVEPEDLQVGDVIQAPLYTESGNLIFEKDTLINHIKLEKLMEIIKLQKLKNFPIIIEKF